MWTDNINKVWQGDCLELMKEMPDNCIDSVVTDPPYGLSFMGKKWDYDVPSVEIWQECLRVLKPGGYLLAFAGTRTQHRMAVRIEDAGFEIRDMIAWVYGSGFPKSLNIGKAVDKLQGNEREEYIDEDFIKRNPKDNSDGVFDSNLKDGIEGAKRSKGTSEWEGWGTALKPALEPITVARKPLSESTVAENCLKWGTGGINIDGSRVGTEELTYGAMKQHMEKRPWSDAQAKGEREKPPPKTVNGRFPANFVHDGSDEVVDLFPKDSQRFFYCAKASKSERNKGCDGLEATRHADRNVDDGVGGDNPRNRTNTLKQNFHPTIKPIALMEYLVKLVSRDNSLVLDPFAGSGSTLIACRNLGINFIGTELSEEYCKIASARLRQQILL